MIDGCSNILIYIPKIVSDNGWEILNENLTIYIYKEN